MNKNVMSAIVRSEARELVEALMYNTESPVPIHTMLKAAHQLLEYTDFGPAAVVIDAFYVIAGRCQKHIEPALLECEDEDEFIAIFLSEIGAAMLEVMTDDEEDECGDDIGRFSFRDFHIPVGPQERESMGFVDFSENEIPFELLSAVLGDKGLADSGCECDECRTKLDEECKNATYEAMRFLQSQGYTVVKAVRGNR